MLIETILYFVVQRSVTVKTTSRFPPVALAIVVMWSLIALVEFFFSFGVVMYVSLSSEIIQKSLPSSSCLRYEINTLVYDFKKGHSHSSSFVLHWPYDTTTRKSRVLSFVHLYFHRLDSNAINTTRVSERIESKNYCPAKDHGRPTAAAKRLIYNHRTILTRLRQSTIP